MVIASRETVCPTQALWPRKERGENPAFCKLKGILPYKTRQVTLLVANPTTENSNTSFNIFILVFAFKCSVQADHEYIQLSHICKKNLSKLCWNNIMLMHPVQIFINIYCKSLGVSHIWIPLLNNYMSCLRDFYKAEIDCPTLKRFYSPSSKFFFSI